jgi:hypothetical protein
LVGVPAYAGIWIRLIAKSTSNPITTFFFIYLPPYLIFSKPLHYLLLSLSSPFAQVLSPISLIRWFKSRATKKYTPLNSVYQPARLDHVSFFFG